MVIKNYHNKSISLVLITCQLNTHIINSNLIMEVTSFSRHHSEQEQGLNPSIAFQAYVFFLAMLGTLIQVMFQGNGVSPIFQKYDAIIWLLLLLYPSTLEQLLLVKGFRLGLLGSFISCLVNCPNLIVVDFSSNIWTVAACFMGLPQQRWHGTICNNYITIFFTKQVVEYPTYLSYSRLVLISHRNHKGFQFRLHLSHLNSKYDAKRTVTIIFVCHF